MFATHRVLTIWGCWFVNFEEKGPGVQIDAWRLTCDDFPAVITRTVTRSQTGKWLSRQFAILSLMICVLSLVVSHYLRKDLLDREWQMTADYIRLHTLYYLAPTDFAAPKSLGILDMSKRALFLGGELVIKGAPGKGTSVTFTVPFKRPGSATLKAAAAS